MDRVGPQFTVIFVALTMRVNFALSERTNSENSAGVSPTGSAPRSARRERISGILIISLSARCSFATISGGVAAGTNTPTTRYRKRAQLTELHLRHGDRKGEKTALHMAVHQIYELRPAAFVLDRSGTTRRALHARERGQPQRGRDADVAARTDRSGSAAIRQVQPATPISHASIRAVANSRSSQPGAATTCTPMGRPTTSPAGTASTASPASV